MTDDERTYTLTESELREALIEAYMAGNYDEADNQGSLDLVLDSAEQRARLVIDVLRASRPPAQPAEDFDHLVTVRVGDLRDALGTHEVYRWDADGDWMPHCRCGVRFPEPESEWPEPWMRHLLAALPPASTSIADAAAAAARESSRGRLDLWRSYPPEDLEWQLLPHAEWWAESYQKQERVDAFMAAARLLATAAPQPREVSDGKQRL